jgi:hypothetical protein
MSMKEDHNKIQLLKANGKVLLCKMRHYEICDKSGT